MALSPRIRILLFLMRFRKQVDFTKVTAAQFRADNKKAIKELKALAQYPHENLFQIRDETIKVSGEGAIVLRIYKPI
ncbi:MAG: hypothetical protein IM575_01610, partial [Cytophagales bacterium]|nr:hypothetical protein [Cytophagales bacterium]